MQREERPDWDSDLEIDPDGMYRATPLHPEVGERSSPALGGGPQPPSGRLAHGDRAQGLNRLGPACLHRALAWLRTACGQRAPRGE